MMLLRHFSFFFKMLPALTSKRLFFTKKWKKNILPKKSCYSTLMDQNCNYHHSLIVLLILVVTKGLPKNIVLKRLCTFIAKY